jgi:hypothetical protein
MVESLLLAPRRSRTALVVTTALGLAIAAGVVLAGPWEEAGARAPWALLGGGAFAVGGVLGWLAKRPR